MKSLNVLALCSIRPSSYQARPISPPPAYVGHGVDHAAVEEREPVRRERRVDGDLVGAVPVEEAGSGERQSLAGAPAISGHGSHRRLRPRSAAWCSASGSKSPRTGSCLSSVSVPVSSAICSTDDGVTIDVRPNRRDVTSGSGLAPNHDDEGLSVEGMIQLADKEIPGQRVRPRLQRHDPDEGLGVGSLAEDQHVSRTRRRLRCARRAGGR